MPADQWVFVHALDDGNELRLTDDHAPPTPTQNWKPGEPITYRRTLFMPPGVEPGTIRFEVGLFSRASGERLPLTGTDRGMRSYEVGTVSVAAPTNPVVPGDGWHDAEAGEGPGRQWNWSRSEGRLAFRNPKAPVTVYLEMNQPVTALPASQAVDVRGPGGSLATVALSAGLDPTGPHPAVAGAVGRGRYGRVDGRSGADVRPGGDASAEEQRHP